MAKLAVASFATHLSVVFFNSFSYARSIYMVKGNQIVAMGGGGFLMEPDNPLLDQYLLDCSSKPKPIVCYLGTASGDSDIGIRRFYASFVKLNCVPKHLGLFEPPTSDLESYILESDVVYVGGGNTRSLLALWREWKLPSIFKKAYEQGVVLGGVSAGSICWFDEGITDSIPGRLSPLRCLGFLPGSNCPHYDGEIERRPAYHRMLEEGVVSPGLAADDGVALHFIDGDLQAVVASRKNVSGYRVSLIDGEVVEEVLETRFLGEGS